MRLQLTWGKSADFPTRVTKSVSHTTSNPAEAASSHETERIEMDPWAGVAKEEKIQNVQVEHVYAYFSQQVLQKTRQIETESELHRKRSYTIKDRNYETYNYVDDEASRKGMEGDEPDDTLSSILVRAMRRKEKRKEIEEIRKVKLFEEEKRRIQEEKRQCREAKRKQIGKLLEMKEAHQLRILKEQQWRTREARLARQNKVAIEFQKKKLLQRYFRGFKTIIELKRENMIKARNHYRYKIIEKAFAKMILNTENEQRWRDEMATNFYNICIIEKYFRLWKQDTEVRRQQFQIAVRHYSNITLRRFLWKWKWWAVDSLLHRRTQIQHAKDHFRRQLLKQSLSHWKWYMDYKKKKRKENVLGSHLRICVKDVLPDFSPTSTDSEDDDDEDERKENERWEAMISVMTV